MQLAKRGRKTPAPSTPAPPQGLPVDPLQLLAISLTAPPVAAPAPMVPTPTARPPRLTYQQGVQFYSDPTNNPLLVQYTQSLFTKEVSNEERQMLFWTVESIAVLAYAVYDHLFFHTYERMFDLGRKQALKEMIERETKMLTALEPVVDVFLTRAESFRDRLDVPCSPGFSDCLAEIANNWKEDIAGIWRALPKEMGL